MKGKNRNQITLVTGGCRSGKSSHAEELVQEISCDRKLYIATCVPHDTEMKDRVLRHRNDRGNSWDTVEIPVETAKEIDLKSNQYNVILLDCLTLWMSNLMMEKNEDEIMDCTDNLIISLSKSCSPVILVTNEVGAGIVPENAIARKFRDIAGRVNQKVAKASDRVVWVVSGIPVTIKQEKKS